MMTINSGAAFLTGSHIDAHVVESHDVDGVSYQLLDNGAVRVVDIESLGIVSINRYATPAKAAAALAAAVDYAEAVAAIL